MIYHFGDCVLDRERRELTVGGAPVHLEPQVFDVLRFLLANHDRVVSRDELIEAVWQGRIVSEATISARIFAARHAVGDTGKAQQVIRTLPRCGFRFVAPVCGDASSPTETASPSQRDQLSTEGRPHGKPWFLKLLMPGNRWRWSMLSLAAATLSATIGGWWMASNQAALDRGEPNPIGVRTVAVMPFDTFSDENEQRFLAQGIAEEITTELSRNADLTVMARSATFSLSEKGGNSRQIASELKVRYILDGSVHRAGEKLRISAKLLDAQTGEYVWANHYDAAASAVYDAQAEIVDNIVGTLLSEVRDHEKRTALRPPSSLDVYALSLRGLALKHRLNAEDLRKGREALRRAVQFDPHYAPVWLYLGWIEAIGVAFRWFDDVTLSEAIQKIDKAIELDPTLPTAYQALGIARAFAGDAQGALRAARRSVELGPGDADNLLFLGRALATSGDFEQAVAYARRAMDLNPSRPSYYAYHLGRALWGTGNPEGSVPLMQECLTKTPGFTACRVFQVANHVEMGNLDKASRALAELRRRDPEYSVEDALKSVGFPGDPDSDKRLARQLMQGGLPSEKDLAAVQ